jgi:replicative DNA helicase
MSDVMLADEAEAAVLGAMLLDPTLRIDLSAADFYRPANATIYSAIRDAGTGADQLVVLDVLRTRGELTRVGGAPYLFELQQAVPSVGNAGFYARQVQQAARRRRILTLATSLRDAMHTPDFDDSLSRAAELHLALALEVDEVTDQRIDVTREVVERGAFIDEPSDPYDWVIPGLLERMDRVIVVASEGAGKSTWARHIAVTLSQGLHPLNPMLRIPPKRTLIVDLENPPANIRRKSRHLKSAAETHGEWLDENVYLWARPGGVNLRKQADRDLLNRVVGYVSPALICLGPIYKAALGGGDKGEQVALETTSALDSVRAQFGCALWLEHHAPMAQGGHRELRPIESGVWSRWPEFGIALRKDGDNRKRYKVERFRGDRDERCWPDYLDWGQQWPFEAGWYDGMPGGLFDGEWGAA